MRGQSTNEARAAQARHTLCRRALPANWAQALERKVMGTAYRALGVSSRKQCDSISYRPTQGLAREEAPRQDGLMTQSRAKAGRSLKTGVRVQGLAFPETRGPGLRAGWGGPTTSSQ